MNKQNKKSDISGIKLHAAAYNTSFIRYQFPDPIGIRELKKGNQIQVRIMTLAPAVDPKGELFYPETAIIFFNN